MQEFACTICFVSIERFVGQFAWHKYLITLCPHLNRVLKSASSPWFLNFRILNFFCSKVNVPLLFKRLVFSFRYRGRDRLDRRSLFSTGEREFVLTSTKLFWQFPRTVRMGRHFHFFPGHARNVHGNPLAFEVENRSKVQKRFFYCVFPSTSIAIVQNIERWNLRYVWSCWLFF